MTAQSVYELRALADQNISGAKKHAERLLFLRLHSNKARCRPARRLAYCLRIGRVVLLSLDEGFDVSRRDQPNIMPTVAVAPPVMRAPAGFHGDDAARLFGKTARTLSRESFLRNPTPQSARAP